MNSNNISIVSVILPYRHSFGENCTCFMQVFSPRTAVNQAILGIFFHKS